MIENAIKVNITALKNALAEGVRVEEIRQDLVNEGAEVKGYKDEDDTVYMLISGNLDLGKVEAVFDEYGVDVNDFIVVEDEYIPANDDEEELPIPDYDSVDTEEEGDEGFVFDCNAYDECGIGEEDGDELNEKKKPGCCPNKKINEKQNNKFNMNLAEALGLKEKTVNQYSLDDVIDSMTGKSINESVAVNAIKKARREMLREKLGDERYNLICESMESGKKSLYETKTINGKRISEYTVEELEALQSKCANKIATLDEADNENMKKMQQLASILEDEISFRKSLELVEADSAEISGLEFKSLNPNESSEEKKDEKKEEVKEADDNSDEEKKDDAEKDDAEKDDAEKDEEKEDDNEKNPDEDEEVEVNSIVITLASKEAAEDLKQDLVDAGVPEDVIEVEPVEDETEEEESEENTEKKSEGSEEENAETESPEESVKSNGEKLNEADDEEKTEGREGDENASEENSEGSEEESEEKDSSYKLTLTDTDYAATMADVLENNWGLPKEELEEMIGGEIVSDESEDGDSEEEGSSDSDDESGLDDFDPDEIFKDI